MTGALYSYPDIFTISQQYLVSVEKSSVKMSFTTSIGVHSVLNVKLPVAASLSPSLPQTAFTDTFRVYAVLPSKPVISYCGVPVTLSVTGSSIPSYEYVISHSVSVPPALHVTVALSVISPAVNAMPDGLRHAGLTSNDTSSIYSGPYPGVPSINTYVSPGFVMFHSYAYHPSCATAGSSV